MPRARCGLPIERPWTEQVLALRTGQTLQRAGTFAVQPRCTRRSGGLSPPVCGANPQTALPKYHRAKLTDHWVRSRLSLRGISRRVSGAVSNQCLSIGPIKTRWDWLGATGSASVADARHALRLTNPRS